MRNSVREESVRFEVGVLYFPKFSSYKYSDLKTVVTGRYKKAASYKMGDKESGIMRGPEYTRVRYMNRNK